MGEPPEHPPQLRELLGVDRGLIPILLSVCFNDLIEEHLMLRLHLPNSPSEPSPNQLKLLEDLLHAERLNLIILLQERKLHSAPLGGDA